MDTNLCPAGCGRFFQTSQGRENHLTQSGTCGWWRRYEKSAALDKVLESVEEENVGVDYMVREGEDDLAEQVGDWLQEFEEDNDIFHFIPLEPELGEAGPGPSTQANQLLHRQLGTKLRTLDDNTGQPEQVIEWKENAGTVIQMDESLHSRWRIAHNLEVDVPMDGTTPLPDQMYSPFASEMDWRIAEWVVKDGIGHKSFDRLLAIPGVGDPGSS